MNHLQRPDWTTPRYQDSKINLSNNICYDVDLLNIVDNLFRTHSLDLRQYPDEYIVYDALSKHHNISAANIAVGMGIGELITRILGQVGSIYIPGKTWPMVEILAHHLGIKYSTTDSKQEAIYIANPNGVDGSYITESNIIELTKKYKFVIIDEAYGDFSLEKISILKNAPALSNVIVLKTFSKSLSLAGLRFGYAVSNTDIINRLQLIRPGCIMHGSIVGIITDLLKEIPKHVDRMLETKTYIESNFECFPSQGNYVLFKEIPEQLHKNFIIKTNRMALTNLELFKNAVGH